MSTISIYFSVCLSEVIIPFFLVRRQKLHQMLQPMFTIGLIHKII